LGGRWESGGLEAGPGEPQVGPRRGLRRIPAGPRPRAPGGPAWRWGHWGAGACGWTATPRCQALGITSGSCGWLTTRSCWSGPPHSLWITLWTAPGLGPPIRAGPDSGLHCSGMRQAAHLVWATLPNGPLSTDEVWRFCTNGSESGRRCGGKPSLSRSVHIRWEQPCGLPEARPRRSAPGLRRDQAARFRAAGPSRSTEVGVKPRLRFTNRLQREKCEISPRGAVNFSFG